MQANWKKAASARLIGAVMVTLMFGTAAPLMAQERLEQAFGIVKACSGDVWRLCSDALPDPVRVKSCVQSKMDQLSKGCLDSLLDSMAGSSFKICKSQTYALCAAARCTVYDGVAYCQCEEKKGDSISLPFVMGNGDDVCSVNAAGAKNNYMVSTYSLPESIVAPKGNRAIYTCEGDDATGAYAQCDGGLCFRAAGETTIPGFDKPVPKGQIVCSCPITQSTSGSPPSFQLLGPYPCDKSFFKYCKSNQKTGSTIYVGAPAGAVEGLAAALNGKVPPLNVCKP